MCEYRYYVKIKLLSENKTIDIIIEADSKDEIRQIVDANHNIIEITRID